MSTTIPRLMATVVSLASLVASGYLLLQSQKVLKSMPDTEPPVVAEAEKEKPGTAHGESTEHGEHAESTAAGHEAKPVKRGLTSAATLVTIDELLANVRSADPNRLHTLGLKLELELFSEDNRALVEQSQSGIKSAIIETAIDSDFSALTTVQGKLYFKEQIIARINTFLNQAVVRDLHFSTFYLQ